MKHHQLALVSALASALAACGGGGQDNTASTSSTTSNATSNVTVNASSTVTSQTVADAAKNAAAAQQAASEAQARAAAQGAELAEARRKAAEAMAQVAAASAQEVAAAQQAADEANQQVQQLQEQMTASQQAVEDAQNQAAILLQQLADLEAQLKPQPPSPADTAQIANGIPACDQNAAPVRDPETNLLLVCESQIVTGAQIADVGTTKHASGRYYVLPFPDHSMMVVGPKAAYKYACGQHFCEWLKMGGSLDIEYAAAGKDGRFHRFSSCRTGVDDKRICAVPLTGFPDGVEYSPDGREAEAPMVGSDVDATDVSGSGGFRAGAARRAPAACAMIQRQVAVLPWPGRDRFRQRDDGTWQALFYGGNCLGDVRVETANPDAPALVLYTTSASDGWPRFSFDVSGPDGQKMELTSVTSMYYDHGCQYRQGRVGSAFSCAYRPVGTASSAGGERPSVVPVTPTPVPTPAPAATPVTRPAVPASPSTAPATPEPGAESENTTAPATPPVDGTGGSETVQEPATTTPASPSTDASAGPASGTAMPSDAESAPAAGSHSGSTTAPLAIAP